uniref:Uncharacterized protein n=1 Tax=Mycena chlorophos TaxID=658473 RepID=A0ABQ0M1K9_MYCCL|nr:predicted protein [Mycena chlorophos]
MQGAAVRLGILAPGRCEGTTKPILESVASSRPSSEVPLASSCHWHSFFNEPHALLFRGNQASPHARKPCSGPARSFRDRDESWPGLSENLRARAFRRRDLLAANFLGPRSIFAVDLANRLSEIRTLEQHLLEDAGKQSGRLGRLVVVEVFMSLEKSRLGKVTSSNDAFRLAKFVEWISNGLCTCSPSAFDQTTTSRDRRPTADSLRRRSPAASCWGYSSVKIHANPLSNAPPVPLAGHHRRVDTPNLLFKLRGASCLRWALGGRLKLWGTFKLSCAYLPFGSGGEQYPFNKAPTLSSDVRTHSVDRALCRLRRTSADRRGQEGPRLRPGDVPMELVPPAQPLSQRLFDRRLRPRQTPAAGVVHQHSRKRAPHAIHYEGQHTAAHLVLHCARERPTLNAKRRSPMGKRLAGRTPPQYFWTEGCLGRGLGGAYERCMFTTARCCCRQEVLELKMYESGALGSGKSSSSPSFRRYRLSEPSLAGKTSTTSPTEHGACFLGKNPRLPPGLPSMALSES